MSNDLGKIGWHDLTVENAEEVRDFYRAVVGWDTTAASQGDYEDYCIHPPGDENPVGGICHKRGPNSNLPSQWLMYVTVADLDASIAASEQHGGKVIVRDRDMGSYGRMGVIEDPAGAVIAILQSS